MRRTLVFLLFVVVGLSCGTNKSGTERDATTPDSVLLDAGPDLTADMTQPAVDGGSDGGADATADAGVVPACGSPSGTAAEATGYVRDGDGYLITGALDAQVIVTNFAEAVITPPLSMSGVPGRRLVVESVIAPYPRWEVQLLIPELPANLVERGQNLRMVVTAKPAGAFASHTVSQTLVLVGVDGLVLFTSNIWAAATSVPLSSDIVATLPSDLLPELSRWGLDLRDAGPSCVSRIPGDACPVVRHGMTATWMGSSGTVLGGGSLDLGRLRLAVGRLEQVLAAGGCDGFSNTRLAGFLSPTPVPSTDAGADAGSGDGPAPDGAAPDSAPALPACSTFSTRQGGGIGCVLNAEGQLDNPPPGTLVQVTSADDAMASCDPSAMSPPRRSFHRFGVQSPDGRTWTILVDIPDLPANLVTVGDTFGLTVTGTREPQFFGSHIYQTVVLNRGDGLALFTSSLFRVATRVGGTTPPAPFGLLPDLTPWGLGLSEGGATCRTVPLPVFPCGYSSHKVRATWQGHEGVTAGVLSLGTLTLKVALHELLSSGGCDGLSAADLTGFVAAAP